MLSDRIKRLAAELHEHLLDPEVTPSRRSRKAGLRALRIAHGVVRDLTVGDLNLQAMSLVYTSLLSIVPVLAVSFSILKAFKFHQQAAPVLREFLEPLGDRGVELSAQIIDWVETLDVGVLGGLGFAFLIFSVLSLIQKIERAFNSTWHISRRQNLAKRIGDYLSIFLIGPVLIFAVLGIVRQALAPLLAWEPLGLLAGLGGRFVPYILVIGAFTLIYLYVPNARVHFVSAFTGALVAGVLWQSAGWLFASVVVSSARFSGIYSGFAIVLLFMIWLYLNWVLLLAGASIAFYHQHPEYLGLAPGGLRLSARLREKLALRTAYLVARRHYDSGDPWSLEDLSTYLRLPADGVARMLDALEAKGLLTVAGPGEDLYLPARALERISLEEVFEAARSADEQPVLAPSRLPPDPKVEELERRIESALRETLDRRTLRDLVLADEPAAADGSS